MTILKLPFKSKKQILALGPESSGNFSFYQNGQVQLSENFGDLLDQKNFKKYKRAISNFLQKNKIKPTVILTDLHPLYHTTIYGQELAKKFKTKLVQVQHHHAHVCSALGEYLSEGQILPKKFIGIACDGTGYGEDGNIWGSEIFKFQEARDKYQINSNDQFPISKFTVQRLGSLENQTLIGGDLAVREPARVLLAILHKAGFEKEKVWPYMKKHYNKNQFELLYNQLLQNFNCQETSSTARILDAASLLLGFCTNQRNYKHEPAELLEKNSKPPNYELRITNYANKNSNYHKVSTTKLFQYLIKNLNKDKKRLAATVQLYIAEGLYEIVKAQNLAPLPALFFSGGLAVNKIMASFMAKKNAYINKKIPPGDTSLSFGQIVYFLLSQ